MQFAGALLVLPRALVAMFSCLRRQGRLLHACFQKVRSIDISTNLGRLAAAGKMLMQPVEGVHVSPDRPHSHCGTLSLGFCSLLYNQKW